MVFCTGWSLAPWLFMGRQVVPVNVDIGSEREGEETESYEKPCASMRYAKRIPKQIDAILHEVGTR